MGCESEVVVKTEPNTKDVKMEVVDEQSVDLVSVKQEEGASKPWGCPIRHETKMKFEPDDR